MFKAFGVLPSDLYMQDAGDMLRLINDLSADDETPRASPEKAETAMLSWLVKKG